VPHHTATVQETPASGGQHERRLRLCFQSQRPSRFKTKPYRPAARADSDRRDSRQSLASASSRWRTSSGDRVESTVKPSDGSMPCPSNARLSRRCERSEPRTAATGRSTSHRPISGTDHPTRPGSIGSKTRLGQSRRQESRGGKEAPGRRDAWAFAVWADRRCQTTLGLLHSDHAL
jgi:hypothetical protein